MKIYLLYQLLKSVLFLFRVYCVLAENTKMGDNFDVTTPRIDRVMNLSDTELQRR